MSSSETRESLTRSAPYLMRASAVLRSQNRSVRSDTRRPAKLMPDPRLGLASPVGCRAVQVGVEVDDREVRHGEGICRDCVRLSKAKRAAKGRAWARASGHGARAMPLGLERGAEVSVTKQLQFLCTVLAWTFALRSTPDCPSRSRDALLYAFGQLADRGAQLARGPEPDCLSRNNHVRASLWP